MGEQQLEPAVFDTKYQVTLDFTGKWETTDGDIIEIIGKYGNRLAYHKPDNKQDIFTITTDKLSHRIHVEGGTK